MPSELALLSAKKAAFLGKKILTLHLDGARGIR